MKFKSKSYSPSTISSSTLHSDRRSKSDSSKVEELAFTYGQTSDSYLACESNRKLFFSKGKNGVISYVNVRGHLKIGGGLLAKQSEKPQLLREFLDFVDATYKSATFFNITEEDLPLFQVHQLQVTKWGEDTAVDLQTWNCSGKQFEWLRRQRNYCTRHQVLCSEWDPVKCSQDEFESTQAELREIIHECLQKKPQIHEMQFFQGALEFSNQSRKRIFVARANEGLGRIEAMVVANPYNNGQGWAFEIYRHRADAIRGVLPHLKLFAIEVFKAEGLQEVSLCMIPGLNCNPDSTGQKTFTQRLYAWAAINLNAIFNCSGLYLYKSRFRPKLESRYICTYPKVSAATFLTTAQLSGLLKVSPLKVSKLLCRQMLDRTRAVMPKFTR